MKPGDKHKIIEELVWHCGAPARARQVEAVLTEPERRDIIRRGFVSKDLWQAIQPRLAAIKTGG